MIRNGGLKGRGFLSGLAVLAVLLCMLFSACSEEAKKEGAYRIYYTNSSHSGIAYRGYDAENTEPLDLIQELWGQLCAGGEEAGKESVVFPDVVLLRYSLDGSNLNLYFNTAVQNMDTASQLLFRASLVMTLTGIKEIESVTFFADETPFTDENYALLGPQTAANYVDIVGNGLSSTRRASLTVYYADKSGEKLLKRTKDTVYASSYSLERSVISMLIRGDAEAGAYATLPSNLQVISINVKNGTCYINFDSSFVTNALPIDGNTIIYSIVNSLCELAEVKRVQIMVNGDSNVTFKGNISLANPLERNLNY